MAGFNFKGTKNRKTLILLIEILALGFFVVGIYSFMQKELNPTQVYKIKRQIDKNSEIELSDLVPVEIPSKAVTKEFLNGKDVELIKNGGMVASADLIPGQYAYSKNIKKGEDIDPFETLDLSTYRKITIPVSYETAVGGDIKKGDKVDLAFVGGIVNKASGEEGSYAKTFMQDVLVYSVATGEGFEYVNHANMKKSELYATGEGTQNPDSSSNISSDDLTAPALVTLAVPIGQAEEILARQDFGKVLIVGRFNESEFTDSSGYIHGVDGLDVNSAVYSGEKNAEKK